MQLLPYVINARSGLCEGVHLCLLNALILDLIDADVEARKYLTHVPVACPGLILVVKLFWRILVLNLVEVDVEGGDLRPVPGDLRPVPRQLRPVPRTLRCLNKHHLM